MSDRQFEGFSRAKTGIRGRHRRDGARSAPHGRDAPPPNSAQGDARRSQSQRPHSRGRGRAASVGAVRQHGAKARRGFVGRARSHRRRLGARGQGAGRQGVHRRQKRPLRAWPVVAGVETGTASPRPRAGPRGPGREERRAAEKRGLTAGRSRRARGRRGRRQRDVRQASGDRRVSGRARSSQSRRGQKRRSHGRRRQEARRRQGGRHAGRRGKEGRRRRREGGEKGRRGRRRRASAT